MELKEYVGDVLTVLKKNGELERLMSNLAEDSALASVKNTILGIEKAVVKDRLVELTEQYLGKADFTEKKEKGKKKKRFSFVRSIDTTPIILTTTPKQTRAQRREEKRKEKEKNWVEAEEGKRLKRKQQLEAELLTLKENE